MFCISERLVTSSRPFWLFIILFIKREWAQRKKSYLFMVSFKMTYFQKSVARSGCFGVFTKIKKGHGTSFYRKFCAYLFHKIFLFKCPNKQPSFNICGEWAIGLRLYNQNRGIPGSKSTWNLFVTLVCLSHSQIWAIPKRKPH